MFQAVLAVWAVALALTQGIVWYATHAFSFGLLLVFLLLVPFFLGELQA